VDAVRRGSEPSSKTINLGLDRPIDKSLIDTDGPARTVLLYAQDGKGMGHITRSLTIARHLIRTYANLSARLVTESPLLDELPLPHGCAYVRLPTHLVSDTLAKTEEDDEAYNQHLSDERARILRNVALLLAPDLVLVDHEPFGHRSEFRDGLYALKARHPNTKLVLGLRDIIDDPARIRAKWEALEVYDALENLYDGIVVYGLPHLFDVAQAYSMPPSIRSKLYYCGYVVQERKAVNTDEIRRMYGLPRDGPLIVATVGGGRDGGPVIEAAKVAVARLQQKLPGLSAVFVTGPFMPLDQQARLRAQSPPRCRVLSTADNFKLIAAADAVVGMGGYNSVWEALSQGRPLVIVPRSTYKREQTIRAEVLASHGLARLLQQADLTGESLAEALEWALTLDPGSQAQRVRQIVPSFDGAARLAAYLSQWLGSERVRHPPIPLETPLARVS
jgi:predicted glycosyltransferase